LPVRLARRCEEMGLLPGLIEPGNSRHGRVFEEFRQDMENVGVRNALVHGSRIEGHSEAVFFLLLDVEGRLGPVQGHLMQIMLPHLHLAFRHVISYNGNGSNEPMNESAGIGMSGREKEILQWMCNGKSNTEIGILLNISPLTVKNHVQKIFRKFKVHNRAQAVSRAVVLRLFGDNN
jgi:transcriptional regulator EpsA